MFGEPASRCLVTAPHSPDPAEGDNLGERLAVFSRTAFFRVRQALLRIC